MNVVQEFTCLICNIRNCTSVKWCKIYHFQKKLWDKKGQRKINGKDRTLWLKFHPTMLKIAQTKDFTHNYCEFHVAECNWCKCCIKRGLWLVHRWLFKKTNGFRWGPLQVDDVLRATNGDYNDDNPSENDYNVDTSDESDAELFSYLYKMKKIKILQCNTKFVIWKKIFIYLW